MKVINADWVSTVVASGSDTGYPSANVLDSHPKKQWVYSPAGATATLTVTRNAISSLSTLAMFNVECLSATITEPGESPIALTLLTIPNSTAYSIYYEFETFDSGDFVVTLTKTATAGECRCGVLLYGSRSEVANYAVGMSEGNIDYSIIKELSNGATYIKQRDLVKTFSCQVQLERTDSEYYDFINGTIREIGPNPTAWLVTDLDNKHWHVYARLSTPASTSHAYNDRSIITIDLIEVL